MPRASTASPTISAAQWFRKAASYGVADSQYNLAILYARGIGVQANLAESYKWFALAAAKGDATRPASATRWGRGSTQSLTAAKLAAQTFVPSRARRGNPSQAPPGGWDPRRPRRPSRGAGAPLPIGAFSSGKL